MKVYKKNYGTIKKKYGQFTIKPVWIKVKNNSEFGDQ